MLPLKLHVEQITRFHGLISKMHTIIENPNTSEKNKGELCMLYFNITSQLWPKIDQFIEYTLKAELDKADEIISKVIKNP